MLRPVMPLTDRAYRRLLTEAEHEIRKTLRALPPLLREKADAVPIICERVPSPEVQGEEVEPDTLGLFIGEAFPEAYAGSHALPAQVILYLENIWEYVHHDPEFYREEVRRTLLHELGHYLGLDEDDLADRDLD